MNIFIVIYSCIHDHVIYCTIVSPRARKVLHMLSIRLINKLCLLNAGKYLNSNQAAIILNKKKEV